MTHEAVDFAFPELQTEEPIERKAPADYSLASLKVDQSTYHPQL